MDRYRLVNSHTCASVENKLLNNTLDYIYKTYDADNIKELIFMGDCALWIKQFPKSRWFKFNKNTKVNFAMDGFHFSQALKQLTTNKYPEVYDALYQYVLSNNKKDFTRLCNEFLDIFPDRKETIESKRDYKLNNWNTKQLYQSNNYMHCSMESHISHIFADIFTSRPKAYSEKGLIQLLKLRLLKINKKNIKELYLKSLNSNTTLEINENEVNFSIFDKQISNFNPLSLINEPIYSIPYDNSYHMFRK